MAWSTREVAELAGTSLRAVRHYHEVGLLPEPERRTNGYKQYGVSHLVRLLRIKRLTDLGFSLAQIEAMGDEDQHPEEALRTLDAELAETIDRLQRARVELGLILRQSVSTDLPAELGSLDPQGMSEADRSMAVVMTRVLGEQSLQVYLDMLQDSPRNPVDDRFDRLTEDAPDDERQSVAEEMAPQLQAVLKAHPGLRDLHSDAPRGERFATTTALRAMKDVYNSAQLDALVRAAKIIGPETTEEDPT
ncbi:MerR family transcriptional regulator [Pseudonocardia sp. HH130630-07]|uniref:MerR family transcriptional regulator n=1 Tax=Pseudonocardia sp. HH130630-07 TaxID=1690815 RepID=UPI000814C36E|nr:MerR family transcriptional regulator [Pseudonocardia sp. HH130630-07]ANY07091.1 MerR family transcriptional regulator [Pseudonocardia sp. HH130630-07]